MSKYVDVELLKLCKDLNVTKGNIPCVDLDEYEEKIRADERAKVFQLVKNYVTFDCDLDLSRAAGVLEFCKKIDELKEQKNETIRK